MPGSETPERETAASGRAEDGEPLARMRRDYRSDPLRERDLAADPMEMFRRWLADARASTLGEPNAMVVSTADADGRPSSRTVLLKGIEPGGFVFFTNYTSRKGREIAANPAISLLFPWHEIGRQVIVAGDAERLGRQESAAYFHSRPHASQLGAWASEQSAVLPSREVLDKRYGELAERFPEGTTVPVPDFWGGIRVAPRTVEFWQGRTNRLHDRLRYRRDGGAWIVERLAP